MTLFYHLHVISQVNNSYTCFFLPVSVDSILNHLLRFFQGLYRLENNSTVALTYVSRNNVNNITKYFEGIEKYRSFDVYKTRFISERLL